MGKGFRSKGMDLGDLIAVILCIPLGIFAVGLMAWAVSWFNALIFG